MGRRIVLILEDAIMNGERVRGRNHAVWIGLLTSIVGLLSYFIIFARFAPVRDFPWINLPLVSIGVGLSIWAIRRRPSFWSVSGAVVSVLAAGLLVFYVFVLSYQLPGDATVVRVGDKAPGFALADHTGNTVRLADFDGTPLVMVFYRGFW
jgi:hypothetical protein